jgi:predicted AAA+ superfamily ATPase
MYIRRDLEGKISKYLNVPEIIAVTGARQVGKTTLLKHIQEKLDKSLFITFEDIVIRALFDNDIKSFITLYIKPYRYIFIDEFQYSKNGGQFLKLIYDTVNDKKIFISGSSILDLTIHAVKYLSGRIFSFVLYPLTFHEYLHYKDAGLYDLLCKAKNKKINPLIAEKIYAQLAEFILYGGYPRVAIAQDIEEKREVLRNILNIYLLRDIRDLVGLTDDYKMLNLMKALALQVGNVISYQELSTLTSQNFSDLRKNLNLLEKTYIISLVKPFYTNKRLEIVKNPKIYFYDTGLRNAVIDDFRKMDSRQDIGNLFESHIFEEFTKKNHTLKYWRTKSKAEVDFIVDDKIPVEVKSAPNKPTISKSLRSFVGKYNPSEAYVFNKNLFETIKINGSYIKFLYHFSDIAKEIITQTSVLHSL